MNKKIVAIASWVIVIWICKVFLFSLPYKFTGHPDTQHIFGTIGGWMSGFLGQGVGQIFSQYGAYIVGSFELMTSIILLSPAIFWLIGLISKSNKTSVRAKIHKFGGLLASAVMAGAVFFHLFTPLGVEVLHEGKSDGGSLFYAAASILVLGIVLFVINSRVEN
ncbi:MAG: hypothetical protein ACR2QW_10685 [bacterium]